MTRRMNLCLMTKWIWRIVQGDVGLWLDLIKAKYLQGQSFAVCSRHNGSQFWRAIQSLKPILRLGATVQVGRGTDTLFWLDCWMDDRPLREQFPTLFAISEQPTISVAHAISEAGQNLSFHRTFGPLETTEWVDMSAAMATMSLLADPNVYSWRLDPSGKFSTKSLYNRLAAGHGPDELMELWTTRLPPKIFFSCGSSLGVDFLPATRCSNGMYPVMVNALYVGWKRTSIISSSIVSLLSFCGIASEKSGKIVGTRPTFRIGTSSCRIARARSADCFG